MTQVRIEGLTKRYGSATAVDRLSLQVENGQFVSLLGPSGCGKTTTLKCIAGFEEVTDGRILFDGRDVSREPPEKRDIGMVFQSYALFPHLTVAGNLAFGLEMRRVPPAAIRERVARALDMVQLAPFAERYPKALSGGQQQRVALARALVIEPRILLLDEPLANLDAKLRDEMRLFIRDLQQRVGITTLYVTHDQSEAMTMSDLVVVMFDGRIAQAAAPQEVYDLPASEAVARFVGNANILQGNVRDGVVHLAGGASPVPMPQLPPGPVRLMARPEQISLVQAGVASDMVGRVDHSYFNGSHVDYRISTDAGDIAVHASTAHIFPAGTPVGLRFDPARLWPMEPRS